MALYKSVYYYYYYYLRGPRVSYAADDAHRPPLHGFPAAARAPLGQTDGQMDTAPF